MNQPFLKWAGGKTQLLKDILPRLPERMETYFEPFIGGGAVFFAVATGKQFKRAVIADRNPHLVDVYKVVRDSVGALIKALAVHQAHATSEEYYYSIRALDADQLDRIDHAARILYLNKTCFNGLYRVNRKGEFNVPFGRYTNPRVLNVEVLENASRCLQKVEILNSDFEFVAQRAREGDTVYFDPPYVPVSETASFTAYDKHVFGPTDHERLARVYRACLERGARAVLSNSDTPLTRSLFAGLDVRTVNATRAINSNALRRGQVTEILVVGARTEARRPRVPARIRAV